MINLYIFIEPGRAAVYGIGTYIRELTEALRGANVNVCAIHLHSETPDKEPETADNIRHYYIPSPIHQNTVLNRNRQNGLYFRNVVYLLQLQMTNTDQLVFHLNSNYNTQLTEELKKAFDCKVVVTVHYLNWCFSLFGNRTRFRRILAPEVTDDEKAIEVSYRDEKELFTKVDHIICLSENTRDILQDDYQINQNKISIIYNGLADSESVIEKLTVRQKYHIPDIPVILFTGRLDDIKGLKYAIQAFRIVLSAYPDCHFIIAGNGSFDACMKECEDIWIHVTWTGLLDRKKLFDLYSIADIGIMPSFHEQCSYVAIEMMMHGIPLIASTTTGLCEMVEDGLTGLHIPVEEHPDRAEIDVSLLSEKMLYLLQHPEERKRMGANARRRYEQVYSSELMYEKMINFYTSLYDTENHTSVMGRCLPA